MLRLVALAPIALVAACAGAAGPCALPARTGRAVDRETGAPIADAVVVERWLGARALSDVASTLHARVAATGADGAFAFGAECRPDLALRGARGPDYALAHPAYGLVRLGERIDEEPVSIAASRSDAAAQRALAALCESPRGEAWERDVARRACSANPQENEPTSRNR